jgi:hypothetical protein
LASHPKDEARTLTAIALNCTLKAKSDSSTDAMIKVLETTSKATHLAKVTEEQNLSSVRAADQ